MQCHQIRPVNSRCSDLKHSLGFSVLEKKNNDTVKRAMLVFLPVLCSSGSEEKRSEGSFSIILSCKSGQGFVPAPGGGGEEQDAAEDGLLGESLIVLLTLLTSRSPRATGLALEGFFIFMGLPGK